MKEHPEHAGQEEADLESATAIIEKLYIRCLTRKPTPEELEVVLQGRPDPKDVKGRRRFYDGIIWALLNSSEFMLNH